MSYLYAATVVILSCYVNIFQHQGSNADQLVGRKAIRNVKATFFIKHAF